MLLAANVLSLIGFVVLGASLGIIVAGIIRSIKGGVELRAKMEIGKLISLFTTIGCALVGISDLLVAKYGWAAMFFGLSIWNLAFYWHYSKKIEAMNKQENPNERE